MKTRNAFVTAASVCGLFLTVQSGLAQGSLTPPGAPAPTMKTLAQIEPRTPVATNTTPGDANDSFIISQPGSYYLTTNIVTTGINGIEITANNVTLDLNGFALEGGANSGSGIYIPSAQNNIVVCNGTISGWGGIGVYSFSPSSFNMVFERLVIYDAYDGLVIEGECQMRNCDSKDNEYAGIYCGGTGTVSGCTANNNGTGIFCTSGIIRGCTANDNGGDGIFCGDGIVTGCVAEGDGLGIFMVSGTVSACVAQNNQQDGIDASGNGCKIVDNNCSGNNSGGGTSSAGILISGSNCRIEDNHVTANGHAGILVSSGVTNNIVIKNSVSGNGASDYIISTGNIAGPLLNATVSGTITNSNPWANFSF